MALFGMELQEKIAGVPGAISVHWYLEVVFTASSSIALIVPADTPPLLVNDARASRSVRQSFASVDKAVKGMKYSSIKDITDINLINNSNENEIKEIENPNKNEEKYL